MRPHSAGLVKRDASMDDSLYRHSYVWKGHTGFLADFIEKALDLYRGTCLLSVSKGNFGRHARGAEGIEREREKTRHSDSRLIEIDKQDIGPGGRSGAVPA